MGDFANQELGGFANARLGTFASTGADPSAAWACLERALFGGDIKRLFTDFG